MKRFMLVAVATLSALLFGAGSALYDAMISDAQRRTHAARMS